MNPKVSVIVPVYNVEKYLSKCIESIINQTLSDIEIILVNDGSTDNSGKIIDEYAVKDKRIKVIHKKNEGQGSARNAGLDIASGEYIGFVDSDDWIDLDMYKKLYLDSKTNNSDISVCSRKLYDSNEEILISVDSEEGVVKNIKDNIHSYVVEKLLFKHTVVVYNKIYKSKIINENNIRFKEVKKVGSEDALFNCELLFYVNIISTINNVYHNQLVREGSTSRKYRVGAMKRTGNLIEELYKYGEGINKKKDVELLAPILLIFFQQWNYNLLKTYANEDLFNSMVIEQREAEKNKYFKRAEKAFISNRNAQVYINKMGYSKKGKLFIKLYMMLSLLGLYKTAIKLRLIL